MEDIYRQFAGVALVLAALVGLLWFIKSRGASMLKFGIGSSARTVTILERIPLTPQHHLFVLSIDGKRVVMASSPSSCQVLSELSDPSKDFGSLRPGSQS